MDQITIIQVIFSEEYHEHGIQQVIEIYGDDHEIQQQIDEHEQMRIVSDHAQNDIMSHQH